MPRGLQLSWEPPDTVYDGLLHDLDAEGRIALSGRSVRLATHTVKLNAREKRILEAFEELGEAEPPVVFNMNDLPQVMEDRSMFVKDLQVDLEADADMIRSMAGYALDQEIFVEFADRQIMHHRALESVRQRLVAYLESHGTVRASEFRGHLGISRAHATALLDYYCDLGVTNRESGTHRLAEGD